MSHDSRIVGLPKPQQLSTGQHDGACRCRLSAGIKLILLVSLFGGLQGCNSVEDAVEQVEPVVTDPVTNVKRERDEQEKKVVLAIQKSGGAVNQMSEDTVSVDFSGQKVSDDEFQQVTYLNDVQQVTIVYVHSDKLTDAGMANFANLPALTQMQLDTPNVTDAGVANIAGLTELHTIDFMNIPMTDAGLVHFKGLVNLRSLNFTNAQITGSGFSNLAELSNLEAVGFINCPLTDAGLEVLAKLPNLQNLALSGTNVSGAGIRHLAGHPKLMSLNLQNTKVTFEEANALRASNPTLRIYH